MAGLLADLNRNRYILRRQWSLLPFDPLAVDAYGERLDALQTVGDYSVLLQLATSAAVLYDRIDDIFNDRQRQQRILELLRKYGPHGVYETIDHLLTFVHYNRSYYASYHHCSNRQLLTQIARLYIHACPDLHARLVVDAPRPVRTDRLVVGFVSNLLTTTHSVAKDRLGIVRALSADDRFDVRILTNAPATDAFFDEVVGADRRLIHPLSTTLSTARQQIADQRLDVLVYPEIGMCQRTRLLAFARLAPIQLTTWGHSDTSGLPEIDYFVSSVYFDDERDARHYSERLLRLESLGTYYYNVVAKCAAPIRCDELDESLDAFAEQHGLRAPTLYGCLQTFFKLHPTFIAILNAILHRDTRGVILLLVHDHRDDVIAYLREHVAHFDRLMLIDHLPYAAFCHAIARCDVVLDYYPFGGFNSTMDSFALGKIVLTKPGPRISGKLTRGLYRKLDIDAFVCDSTEEYVEKAVYYATHPDARAPFERLIRERLSRVFEDADSVRDWAQMLLTLRTRVDPT